MKKCLLFFSIVASLVSCNEEDYINNNDLTSKELNQSFYDEKEVYKQEFSVALAKALAKNTELREFIKNESLKMFDNDYDILYQMVKDEKIGDISFRDIILEYYDVKENLNILEQYYPTLTIFVPELPLNTFSAKNWNVESEIPLVAYTLIGVYDIPIVDNTGKITFLKGEFIPSFPVLVVKENERVRVSSSSDNKRMKTSIIGKGSYQFEFLDDSFNGALTNSNLNLRAPRPPKSSRNTTVTIDDKLIKAYQLYKNTDGWQRDYVYYDITPSEDRGQFKYNYMEHLTSFRLNNAGVLNKISDQTGDPVINQNYSTSPLFTNIARAPWTGGYFEFRVNILLNAKNGVGTSINKYFSVKPEELYFADYIEHIGPFKEIIYMLDSLTPKIVPLNIGLFNWDLNEYASSIKIFIEEVDLTEELSTTDTRTVEFATNFGIDPNEGLLKKMGLKFGSSMKDTRTTTTVYKVTKESDQLGDVIINFADNFLIDIPGSRIPNGIYHPREYDSGDYTLTIQPKKVQ